MATMSAASVAGSSRRSARWGSPARASPASASRATSCTGPSRCGCWCGEAAAAGVDAAYREIETTKGHDGFLTEWDQLAQLLGDALADGFSRDAGRWETEAVAATG